jgi:aminoglycoside phosphotransferase family enzyme/predicted kinase
LILVKVLASLLIRVKGRLRRPIGCFALPGSCAMDDQREVVAFLADGGSYGKPGATVERTETHISIIFLVGERAYKLKRAVRFSYLDYSTLERREEFCRKELALNRRTAPDLYLGLRAITRRQDGSLAFDGDGTVLDWVVEMRRFAQSDLLDKMAEVRRLSPQLMRDLTDAIVAFHETAQVTGAYGGRSALAETVAGNNANLLQCSPPLARGEIRLLEVASQSALAAVGGLLDRRRREGKVRRCHGDLHLRNVVLFEGRPTLFDCIEFSDAFACVDVLYDLAFLVMDLAHRGLTDAANLVFNRYLDLTADIDGLRALPLLLSARAGVRAHVLGAQYRQSPSAGTLKEAQSYLSLACTLLRAHPPRLIAIGGLSGTGKSTVAHALAGGFLPPPGARVVRSDVLRKRLFNVAPEAKLPPEAYDMATNDRVYRALRDHAEASLSAGYTAIVDAAFLRQEERAHIASFAKDAGVPFAGLWLEAPGNVLAQRIAARRSDASDADLAVLQRQLGMDLGAILWNRIDAGQDTAATVARVRDVIARIG